jgi:hypothetical protein
VKLEEVLQIVQTVLLFISAFSGPTSLLLILVERRNRESLTKKNLAEANKVLAEKDKVSTETRLVKEEYYQKVANELFEKYEGLKKMHEELKALYDTLEKEALRLKEESVRLRVAIEYIFGEIKDHFPQVVEQARRIISPDSGGA